MSAFAHHTTSTSLIGLSPSRTALRLTAVVAASCFVALCAHLSLPLLCTPVPLTLGNFAVLVVGLLLGPRLGFAALALYLAEGAVGMPVFNPGPGGVAQLIGPTAGYLFAYPFAAAVAGWMIHKFASRNGKFLAGLAGGTLATALLLSTGTLWLGHFAHLSSHTALVAGLLPFLPGEVLKIVVAAGLCTTLTRKPRQLL